MDHKNGKQWIDTSGKPIQAHGGMILQFENYFYWYGEHKGQENIQSSIGDSKVDFIGISCYRSEDLIHWHNEGLVLEASNDNNHLLHTSKIVERPKVIYNQVSKKFIMWFHYDTDDYLYAAAGIAISDSPIGPFELINIFKPNRKDVRDMTLYQENEKAYLIHSSDFNKTLYISELTEDYMDVTGQYTKILVDQEREAPTIFKTNNYYFMITSGTSGWKPNEALLSRSTHLYTPAKIIGNPLIGPNYRKTFFGQPTYIFKNDNQFYLMLDHWQPEHLSASGYSILPIILSDDGKDITVPWTDHPFINLLNKEVK